ncbi:MAG: hypothetical protein H8D70_01830, partial [Rhodospirillaceae bacterium]|nr:hypothetical protein [Rhodospirillaceae bacterium]
MINISLFQRVTVALICVLGVLYALPNLMSKGAFEDFPDWMPGKTISLGLDLQGGLHLLLKVETDVAIDEMVGNLEGDIREVLRLGEIKTFPKNMKISGNAVQFDISHPEKRERVRELVFQRNPGVSIDTLDAGGFRIEFTEQAIADKRRETVQQALEIIRIRIDQKGVREPTIQQQGEERILLQI